MKRSQVDVLVVGAGPGGSAAAFHLARAGLDVLAVDRAAFPRDKPCSEYMSPEAVRLLDRIGIVSRLEKAGASPLHGTTVVGPRGSRLTGRFSLAGVTPFRPTGISVPRLVLDALLVEAAREAGAEVAERTSVEGLLYEDGGVAGAVLRGADGSSHSIRARLVIGADGLRSMVAQRFGRRRHGMPSRMAFVAHVSDVEGLGDVAEMHVGAEGYVGLNPLGTRADGSSTTNVALVVPQAVARAARGRVDAFFFERLARFPGVRGRVRSDRVVRKVLVTGPFAAWSRQVVVDGALLIGDAADFFDPFTGEGIYSAIRGAEMATDAAVHALAGQRRASATGLAGYRAARRSAFAGKWAVERLIGWAMLAPTIFDRAVDRLERRGLSHTLIGVTGDFVPARDVLHPLFLAKVAF